MTGYIGSQEIRLNNLIDNGFIDNTFSDWTINSVYDMTTYSD